MRTATTTLILCVGGLLAAGMIMLYSISMVESSPYLRLQGIWAAVGIVVCATAAFLDYRWLKKFSWVIFAMAVLALVLVLIPGLGTVAHEFARFNDGFNAKLSASNPPKQRCDFHS